MGWFKRKKLCGPFDITSCVEFAVNENQDNVFRWICSECGDDLYGGIKQHETWNEDTGVKCRNNHIFTLSKSVHDTIISNCRKTIPNINEETESHFDDELVADRIAYLISRFVLGNSNISDVPPDPENYESDTCWVCQDPSARYYQGFRRICEACKELALSYENGENFENMATQIVSRRDKCIKAALIRSKEEEAAAKKRASSRKRKELQLEKDKNASDKILTDLCKKYLKNKEFDFKGIILGIEKNPDLKWLVEEDDIEDLKHHFVQLYSQAEQSSPTTSHEYDEVMETQNQSEMGFQLTEDMTKLLKVVEKQGGKTDYKRIFDKLVLICKNDVQKLVEKLSVPAYKRISRKANLDKKKIVKEYINIGLDDISDLVISDIFERFGYSYTNDEVNKLIQECLEEAEIERFEKELGANKKITLGDYKKLNGAQFESYLKDVFSALDYKVIVTKNSGDQGADLIIKDNDTKKVVQAKKYSGAVSNKAIQEVVAAKKYYKAQGAMVVTTGKYTKSAMQLAKSNNVELWDGAKLKEVVDDINKKCNANQGLQSQTKSSLEGDGFPVNCPFCTSDFTIKLDKLPPKTKSIQIQCDECGSDLAISIPEEFYLCGGCKNTFNTIAERVKHSKTCKKLKEREFTCTHCKSTMVLDDNELEELTSKKKIAVNCPKCDEIVELKKK